MAISFIKREHALDIKTEMDTGRVTFWDQLQGDTPYLSVSLYKNIIGLRYVLVSVTPPQ
jgi:hypothetical protein